MADHTIETETQATPPEEQAAATDTPTYGPALPPPATDLNGGTDTDPDTATAPVTEVGENGNGQPAAPPMTRAERRAAKTKTDASGADAVATTKRQRSGFRHVADLTGRILIGAGVILLLFTAYQIWGTSIQESHSQNQLRQQLTSEAHKRSVADALTVASTKDQLPTGPPIAAPHTDAPPEGSPIGDIRIPAIGLNQVVVEGTNTDDLRQGPGHYIGTPLPGQSGNSAIAGHRTTYGHPFYNLDGVKPGDPIVVTTLQGVFQYDTFKQVVVSPSDTTVIDNVFANYLTLTTCNPRFSATTRLVVVAKLVHSDLFKGAAVPAAKTTHKGPVAQELAGDSSVQLSDALIWGFFVVLVGGLVLYLGRRFRRFRWPVWVFGTLGVLVLLYAFFGAVSPLLPASF